jgi:glycosyl transferase family 25
MIKTYIINLKKDTKRWNNMEKLLKDSKLEIIRYEGIYGKEMTENEINDNTNIMCRNILCNYGMIGCAMSHITLWKKLLNEKENNFLILEDDIININLEKLYKLIDNLDTFEWDIISLQILHNINQKVIKEIDDIKIVNSLIPLTTAGYIINKDGLKKLIDIIEKNKISYHIDFNMMILKYLKNIKYYNTDPNIIITSKTDSSIQIINNTPILFILKKLRFNNLIWYLSIIVITIKLKYSISFYHIILLLLFILNLKIFKSVILLIIIIIEFIFLFPK